jgi:hypothetical protein
MGYVHLHRPWWRGTYNTPAWASHERLTDLPPDERVLTECCCCRMRADETVAVVTSHLDAPLGMQWHERPYPRRHEDWDRDREPADYFISWYDPTVRITCGPGFGCDANPRRLRGKAMREWWRP